jgi:hypothetical protein
VGLGKAEAEVALLGAAAEHLGREEVRALPFVGVRRQLVGHPPPDGLAKVLVLLGEGGARAALEVSLGAASGGGHRRGRLLR